MSEFSEIPTNFIMMCKNSNYVVSCLIGEKCQMDEKAKWLYGQK
jgi:hypothetical protein